MKRITWLVVIFSFVLFLLSLVFHINMEFDNKAYMKEIKEVQYSVSAEELADMRTKHERTEFIVEALEVAYIFYLIPITLLLNIHLFLLLKENKSVKVASLVLFAIIHMSFAPHLLLGTLISSYLESAVLFISLLFFFFTSIASLTVILSVNIKKAFVHFLSVIVTSIVLYGILLYAFQT